MKSFFSFLLVAALVIGSIVVYTKSHTGYVYSSSICPGRETAGDSCVTDFYANLVDKYGEQVAIADLKKRFNNDGYIAAQCHPIIHIVGAEASKKYSSPSEAFLHGDPFCWSGYYHGVMEGIIARIGEDALPQKLNTICDGITGKEKYSFDYFNCVHGLGHGIMELKGDNLFDSLAMCDNLTGDWEQQSCQSGVFMENIISYNHNGTSNYLKKDDPLYPCPAVKDKYKFQCYLGQTSYALEVSNYDFKKVSDLCTTVAAPFRGVCFQSYGRDAGNQAGHAVGNTKQLCAIPRNASDEQDCVVGAVKEFISYYHDIKQANDFCNALDTAQKQNCLTTGAEYYKVF